MASSNDNCCNSSDDHGAAARDSDGRGAGSSQIVAADMSNARGNRCYREGSFERATAAYTEALQLLLPASVHQRHLKHLVTGGTGDAEVVERLKCRSKYFANRAQARMQLKDFEEAAEDCRASVSEDPRNAKALVRWALCEEALEHWDDALKLFERASALLQWGTALHKTALGGARRARTNGQVDRKVAHEEAMPQELVHVGQMLRLSFRDPLPTECRPGEWFCISLGLSNEFGLWRRSDFDRSAAETGAVAAETPSTFAASPSSKASLQSETRPGRGETSAETANPVKRIRLVVEGHDLEGFGGRSLSRRPRWRQTQAGGRVASGRRKCCDCEAPSAPPSPSVEGSPPARQLGRPHAAGEGLQLSVETDGEQSIGSDGKTTLRARFVAYACSGRAGCEGGGHDGAPAAPVSKEGAGVAIYGVFLMLLRVSVIEDDATSLLGRQVVPVLSLPIAVSGAPAVSHGPVAARAEEGGGGRLAEQRALAENAFRAGAVSCREVTVPIAGAVAPATGTSEQQRWGDTCDNGDGRMRDPSGTGKRSAVDSNGSSMCGGDNSKCGGGGGGDDESSVFVEERVVLVAESPGQLGIGGKVWDSAFVLCEFLAKAQASCAADDECPPTGPNGYPSAGSMPSGANGCFSRSSGGDVKEAAAAGTKERVLMESSTEELDERSRVTATNGTGRATAGVNGDCSTIEPAKGNAECHVLVTPSVFGPSSSCLEGRSARGLVQGRRVLELGAGTGLVSVCCALLGASAVVATDFQGVTELIRVNVALNFPGASPSPSTLHRLPLPSPGVTPGARQCSTSAPALGAVVADTETIDPKAAQERAAGSDSTCPAFASAATINGDSTRPLSPPPVFVAEAGVPVTTVPLIWGESSVEAEEFGAEVVVMSDVVYDPAGYEPLLRTLLDIMRPGMIAVMAHRHRHPEDHVFFSRLQDLFHVAEERMLTRRGKSRDSSPSPPPPEALTTTKTVSSSTVSDSTVSGVPSIVSSDVAAAADVHADKGETEGAGDGSGTPGATRKSSEPCFWSGAPDGSVGLDAGGEKLVGSSDGGGNPRSCALAAGNGPGSARKGAVAERREGEDGGGVARRDGADVRIFRIWNR